MAAKKGSSRNRNDSEEDEEESSEEEAVATGDELSDGGDGASAPTEKASIKTKRLRIEESDED